MSCFAGPYNRGIVTSGLVLYYDVNEPVCYSSGRTDIQDLSRNGNVGTLVNGVGYSANNGGSLVFDGVNDYADTNKYFDAVFTGTNSFSIGCCVNPSSTQVQYANIFGNHSSATQPNSGIVLQQNSTTNNQYFFAYGTGTIYKISSNFNLTASVYNYLTVTKNSTYTSVYVNGTRIVYNNFTESVSPSTSLTFKIGLGFTSTRYWKGNISSFNIYNKELSASEILQNFNAHKDRFGL